MVGVNSMNKQSAAGNPFAAGKQFAANSPSAAGTRPFAGGKRFASLFALLLLAATATHAADTGAETLRAYCAVLLNTLPDNSTNTTQIVILDITNFTYGKQYQSALEDLKTANASVEKLKQASLPYLQPYDTYLVAKQWLDGQASLERGGGTGDYKFVVAKALEIKALERDTLAASDELSALQSRISNVEPDVGISAVLELQKEAKQEFLDGRFTESKSLIDQAYDKIATAETETARSKTLLESTRRNITVFLQENWQKILVGFFSIAAILFIFQRQIRHFMINARMKSLVAEKSVLERMLQNLQKDYFEHGKVNELSYHIKTKKFGDLIRNINRQIPLLKEELRKI
jgi:hypothetical protein